MKHLIKITPFLIFLFCFCKEEENELGYCLETFENGHGVCWLISKHECEGYAEEGKNGSKWVFTGPECEAKGYCQAINPETDCHEKCLQGFTASECDERDKNSVNGLDWNFTGIICFPDDLDC